MIQWVLSYRVEFCQALIICMFANVFDNLLKVLRGLNVKIEWVLIDSVYLHKY